MDLHVENVNRQPITGDGRPRGQMSCGHAQIHFCFTFFGKYFKSFFSELSATVIVLSVVLPIVVVVTAAVWLFARTVRLVY
jgi:hypothetical protein